MRNLCCRSIPVGRLWASDIWIMVFSSASSEHLTLSRCRWAPDDSTEYFTSLLLHAPLLVSRPQRFTMLSCPYPPLNQFFDGPVIARMLCFRTKRNFFSFLVSGRQTSMGPWQDSRQNLIHSAMRCEATPCCDGCAWHSMEITRRRKLKNINRLWKDFFLLSVCAHLLFLMHFFCCCCFVVMM